VPYASDHAASRSCSILYELQRLERAFGRGINFQIGASDVDALAAKVQAAGYPLFIALEDRRYRVREGRHIVQRQFVVADPDGYLLRFIRAID
jgi:hypothetical protein